MATTTQTPERTGLTWEQVCNDPNLQDLPYKIETNEYGQIVMSPTYQWHGAQQAEILILLREHLTDRTVGECAIETSKGTKVADAGWYSPERWEKVKHAYATPLAPQICVEVFSGSNTAAEIDEKKRLYFEAGAEEVWTCDREGRMRFFDENRELEASKRAPAFPKAIEV